MGRTLLRYVVSLAIALSLLFATAHAASGNEKVIIGVHGYDGADHFADDWQPLADYLSSQMQGYEVSIVKLDRGSLNSSLQHHRLDFLFTDPGFFVQLRESNSMAQAISTVVGSNNGLPVVATAGVIVARGDRRDLNRLDDLRGMKIGHDDKSHLATYQAQAHTFFVAGLNLEAMAKLRRMDDDNGEQKLAKLMSGELDAVFLRAGVMEQLASEGRIRINDYKIINRQLLPGYPYAASTRLYAERVIVALPYVAPETSQQLVTALYSLSSGAAQLKKVGIHGFTLPADYMAVVRVARDLRIPPFDVAPRISVADLWHQYRDWIVISILTALVMATLALSLVFSNRRLHTAKKNLESAKHLLENSEALLKNTITKMRANNERFALVMRASNDGVWDWDFVTDQVYYSPRWFSMLGYEEGELEPHFTSWEKLVDIHDRDVVMAQVRSCIQGESDGFVAEYRMRHKDGTWRDILSRGIVVRNESGQVLRFAGTHMDITERKALERSLQQKENQLVTIIDHLPLILFVKDARDLRYMRFNRYGERLLGLAHGQYLGHTDHELFPRERADKCYREDVQVLTTQTPLLNDEEVIDTPSGRRQLITHKLAITDEKGGSQLLLGIAEDITEKKQAERERARLSRELQQAQKMESLGQLTGGIAHDFNNLLAIINGYSGLALANCESRGEEKLAGYMQQLIKAGERAASLVAQMLAFSRIDQSADKPIHFTPLIKEDVKMLRATLPTTIDIRCDVEEDLPPVLMNPTQLHQILMNLSINARDAMAGEGELHIRLGWARNLDTESPVSHKPVKGDWIELSVRDTGSGIEPEIIDKIFNPFFTTKEVGKGTGLGLSVVYSIMEAHNGHIIVESIPGEGTTLRMLFMPYLVENHEGNIAGTHEEALPVGDGSEILVVDDEESIALFIAELLNQHGYQASALSGSEEALALFTNQATRFSLLITDQTMPHLTGIELIKRARLLRPGLPAIICTGYSDKIDAAGAEVLGVSFFHKPVEHIQLLKEVARLLQPLASRSELSS